jgi:hypothetical protein
LSAGFFNPWGTNTQIIVSSLIEKVIRGQGRRLMKRGATWISAVLLALTTSAAAQEQTSPHKVQAMACEKCHNESEWHKVNFAHKETRFQLEGRHQDVSCRECHDLADFSKVSSRCDGCHADVHQGKQTMDCVRCHTADGWRIIDVTQAHAATLFPLVGRHAVVDCGSCHPAQQQGDFFGLTTACIDCHAAELQMVKNPDHRAMGFPSLCGDCHQWLAWKPAAFTAHDGFFPIDSGTHAGVWSSCATCHQTTGNYKDFSCFTGCHEHGQSSTDRKHREVRNYRYDSQACYGCHSNGQGDD